MKKIVKTSTVVVTVLLLLVVVSIRAYAQEDEKKAADPEKKALSVPKVESPIKIDGHLDEEAWKNALKFEPSIELRPGENIEAPVRTEAFVLYSSTHFYVGVHAYDPDPSAIRARYTDRDKIWSDDWIAIVLDTFSDKRHIYNFVCNPFGIQGESMESISGNVNLGWDTIWKSSGRIVDDGYILEIGIPFTSMRIPRKKGLQVWGFDVTRNYPRNFETLIGLFARPRNYNCYTCLMEKISGFFASKKRGKNFEIA
ncbi:MAG: carbohydrate binding family 9 domain-containing protein, partial [bacterium]|nr:carbohydrate binding family 9 domain-containing protein [bacterium]